MYPLHGTIVEARASHIVLQHMLQVTKKPYSLVKRVNRTHWYMLEPIQLSAIHMYYVKYTSIEQRDLEKAPSVTTLSNQSFMIVARDLNSKLGET